MLASWADLTYAELAGQLLGLLAPDFDQDDLAACTHGAYAPEVFAREEIAPVSQLGADAYLLELSHGAFNQRECPAVYPGHPHR